MIIALINNKGGVGKTTTAVNLAAAFAKQSPPVLIIDLDSQGATGLSLGVARAEFKPSISDVIMRGAEIETVIRQTNIPGLDLITGTIDLAEFDQMLSGRDHKESRLKNALEPVRGKYTHIFIDCPPSFSLLAANALLAADYYVVPVTPNVLTISGLASLVEEINRLCDRVHANVAHLLGIVLTMVDYRNRSTQQLVETMRANWQDHVFDSEIRINVKLAEAPALGKSIYDYAPGSTGAAGYRELAKEIAGRLASEQAGGNVSGGESPSVESAETPQPTAV